MSNWLLQAGSARPFFVAASFVVIALLTMANPQAALAGEVTLTWDPNSESDLAGYNVYQSTTSGSYTFGAPVAVIQGNVTTYRATNLSAGQTYFFVVTAFDTSNNESGPSNEASGLPRPTLTLVRAGSGSGTVTSSPAGISCGSDCSYGFTSGTVVTLSASPDAGSVFSGWSGAGCSGTSTCTVSLTADTTVTATFDPVPTTLSVTKLGTGSGTVTSSPGGISCGFDCGEVYDGGTVVTLTATPDAGSIFSGWSGSTCSGSGSCTVTLTADTTVSATFDIKPPSLISNLTVASGKAYEVVDFALQTGTAVYIDRAYTFTTVPASVARATYIKTANDDKAETNAGFLSFDVDQPATVYVAYDTQSIPTPSWLGVFTDTGEDLVTSDTTLRLFAKGFPAGIVTLGANEGGSTSSMYSVVVVAQASAGLQPRILAGLGSHSSSGGFLEAIEPLSPHAHMAWPRVPWSTYNSADGQTRPATCDVDGDGKDEVVVGLGPLPGNGGWVEILDDQDTDYAHLAWVRVSFATYNDANGETFPACGDLDGDSRGEIVVGLGPEGQGWVQIFDDATTGFQPMPGTPIANGWLRLNWTAYNDTGGEVHPATGNLDGDPAHEVVLGLASGGAGWVQILDDASTGFSPLAGTPTSNGWVRVNWTAYTDANGETRPAVCDLNGDGQGELALGLGSGGGGWVKLFDSATGFSALAGTPTENGWVRMSWMQYTITGGGVHPACGDLDDDGRDELLLGIDSFPSSGGWIEIKEDLAGNLSHLSWPRIRWDAYNNANGETRPVVAR